MKETEITLKKNENNPRNEFNEYFTGISDLRNEWKDIKWIENLISNNIHSQVFIANIQIQYILCALEHIIR